MTVTREDAIELATAFALANGYRVVPNFDGVDWQFDGWPVKFQVAHVVNGDWVVLFDRMLPPGVESMSPDDVCVIVSPEGGECRFYPLL
jgi:hypothetical protein